jgi:hypothetical protein
MSKTSIRTFTLLIWAFRSPLGLPSSNSLTERFNIIFAELKISLLHEGSTAGNTGNRCSERDKDLLQFGDQLENLMLKNLDHL